MVTMVSCCGDVNDKFSKKCKLLGDLMKNWTRPNIIFLMTDQQRCDEGIRGSWRRASEMADFVRPTARATSVSVICCIQMSTRLGLEATRRQG